MNTGIAANRVAPAESLLRLANAALDLAKAELARRQETLRTAQSDESAVASRIAAVYAFKTIAANTATATVLLDLQYVYLRQLSALKASMEGRSRQAETSLDDAIDVTVERFREVELLERYLLRQAERAHLAFHRKSMRFDDDAWLRLAGHRGDAA